jgi:hypothetical protein
MASFGTVSNDRGPLSKAIVGTVATLANEISALKAAQTLRIDANQQAPHAESGPRSVSELIAHHRLKELAGESKGRKAFSTRAAYECYLNRWILPRWGDLRIDQMPCKVRDPDRKGKVEAGVAHAQKTPLKGEPSRAWRRPKLIWTTGKSTGLIRASMAAPNVRRSDVRRREAHPAGVATGAVPLLPVGRSDGASGRLGRGGGRLLGGASRLDRPQVHVQWDSMYVRLLDPRTGELLREHL